VIVIGGSNGKTTVKEMLAAILRAHFGDQAVLATAGNLNNAIGLPLTLLGLRAEHRVAAVEVGMNHRGETAALAAIAQPTVALINNAQREAPGIHAQRQRGRRRARRSRPRTAAGGVAVLNADDAHIDVWRDATRERGHRRRRIALGHPAAVRGRHVRGTPRRSGCTPAGDATARIEAPGRHNAVMRCGSGDGARDQCRSLPSCADLPPSRPVVAAGRSCRCARRFRDRRQLQRQPGFGARRDRRAGGRTVAEMAGAG
jgi:UDP-N-acetylmuramoyl-tripeptide--D-alanyl-D-alanine ligase